MDAAHSNEASLQSEIRLEVRIWSEHNPDPQRRQLLAVTDEGEPTRGRVAQQRGRQGSNQLSERGRGRAGEEGSEDDKVHAEEVHVGR